MTLKGSCHLSGDTCAMLFVVGDQSWHHWAIIVHKQCMRQAQNKLKSVFHGKSAGLE